MLAGQIVGFSEGDSDIVVFVGNLGWVSPAALEPDPELVFARLVVVLLVSLERLGQVQLDPMHLCCFEVAWRSLLRFAAAGHQSIGCSLI